MTASNFPSAARAWADIRLAALVANARTVQATSGTRLLPMVKANGYGIGAIAAARALEQLEPWGYGVATPDEGLELRQAGITRPVVVFTPMLPSQVEACLAGDLRPVIGDLAALRAWTAQGQRPFHIEIDTGMSRAGFRWTDRDRLEALGRNLPDCPGWEGIFTHFHSADEGAGVEEQWRRFATVLAALPARPLLVHAANSAAALQGTAYAADLVRPGIFLYGGAVDGHDPEPVVAFRARVVASRRVRPGETVSYGATWRAERETTVVTIAAGYADGVPRSLSNRSVVELNGELAPIVGRVTMDMITVAAHAPAAPGDVATLFGGRVSLDRQAEAAGTIAYELLTSMGRRVTRHYLEPV